MAFSLIRFGILSLIFLAAFACSENPEESEDAPPTPPTTEVRQQFLLQVAYANNDGFLDEPAMQKIAKGEKRLKFYLGGASYAEDALELMPEELVKEFETTGWTTDDLANHTSLAKEGSDYFFRLSCDCSEEFARAYPFYWIQSYNQVRSNLSKSFYQVEQMAVENPIYKNFDRYEELLEIVSNNEDIDLHEAGIQNALVEIFDDCNFLLLLNYELEILESRLDHGGRKWKVFMMEEAYDIEYDVIDQMEELTGLYDQKASLQLNASPDAPEIKAINGEILAMIDKIKNYCVETREKNDREFEEKLEQISIIMKGHESLGTADGGYFLRRYRKMLDKLKSIQKSLKRLTCVGGQTEFDFMEINNYKPVVTKI